MPIHLGLITSSYYYLIMIACGSDSKGSASSAEHSGLIPGLGRSTGEGSVYPLQYSCLENSKDRVAWWATVSGVIKLDMTEQLITIRTYLVVITNLESFGE